MAKLDDVIAFRSSTRPFMALWTIDDVQAYGTFRWHNGKPLITLIVDVETGNTKVNDDPDLPIFNLTKPPMQTNITGRVERLGVITLESCSRYNVHVLSSLREGRSTYELDFLPTAIWTGAQKSDIERRVMSVVASDTRLAGFFGSHGVKTYGTFDRAPEGVLEALGQPRRVWAVYEPSHSDIKIGDTGWILSVHAEVSDSFSATLGLSLKSITNIYLTAPRHATIEEASKIIRCIEDIISTFSIESFNFQCEDYRSDIFTGTCLVWRLGEDRSIFQSPMRHQILIDLSDPVTLQAVCGKWFLASSNLSLSRWLFTRALRETDDGLARFVSVAQAFEVLGRELGPEKRMPKKRLKEAVSLIKDALSGRFESDFIDRVSGLIQSSNKASYRDVLAHMLGGVVQRLQLGSVENVSKISKDVSDIRNAVIHMTDDDKGKLNAAFSKVNKVSLQLCFWFAVCQADHMKLNIPDISRFLFNNRNARHGLPNEVLDRS